MDLYILCRKRMLVWFYRQRQRKMFIHSGCKEKWGTNIDWACIERTMAEIRNLFQ